MELLAGQMKTILLRASHIVLTNHSSVSFYKTSWLQFYLTFAYPGKKKEQTAVSFSLLKRKVLSLIFCTLRAKHLEAEPGDLTRPQAIIVLLPCLCLNVYVALEKDKSPFPL